MSQAAPIASSSSSSSSFLPIFTAALDTYDKTTKKKLLTNPLAAQLQSCDSSTTILSVLQDLAQQLDESRSSDQRLTNWLSPTVNVLFAFSATLGEGVGLVGLESLSHENPGSDFHFSGIVACESDICWDRCPSFGEYFSRSHGADYCNNVIYQAAKDVDASQDVLVDLFSRMENFFKRLESYTEISPTPAMTSIIVKIMVEVLTILGIATKEMKQRRSSESMNVYHSFLTKISPEKILKKILGKNDIEDALKRLDTLTQEEARMVTAEIWKATRSVNDQVAVLINGAQNSVSLVTFMFLNTDWSDGKEGKAIIQQTASNVEEGMRSSSKIFAVGSHDLIILVGDQLREKLQTWLSPPDPSTNHNLARKVHHRGTATWFFQGSIFQEWKSYPSLLWIHGKRTSLHPLLQPPIPYSPLS